MHTLCLDMFVCTPLTLKVDKTQWLGDRKALLSGKEVSLWGAEHVLELDRCGSCSTL